MFKDLTCIKVLRYVFSLACFSAAFGMTIFWLHRFLKDEDLCLVDYVNYQNALDMPQPMVSICIDYPFIESKLQAYNANQDAYVEFLQGKRFDTRLERLDFEDVTMKITDFYQGDILQWRNGTYKEGDYPNNINTMPHVTFAGFWYGLPIKCFGLGLPSKDVKYGYFAFNVDHLQNASHGPGTSLSPCAKNSLTLIFHVANQMVLTSDIWTEICPQKNINTEQVVDLMINNVEFVQRRNKPNDPCISNYQEYDSNIMKMHIDKIGCRPPYLKTRKNMTSCNTQEKLKDAMVMDLGDAADESTPPCLSVGHFGFITSGAYRPDMVSKGPNYSWLNLTPPKKIKVINQVKAVDIQTVIGNAGGYVGLFLGKCCPADNKK